MKYPMTYNIRNKAMYMQYSFTNLYVVNVVCNHLIICYNAQVKIIKHPLTYLLFMVQIVIKIYDRTSGT